MPLGVHIEPELLHRLQRNEEPAFRQIYDRLYPGVFRFVDRWVKDVPVSEEIVQEAFVQIWLNRNKLETPSHVSGFLYKAARRMAVDHFRKRITELRASRLLSQQMTEWCDVTEQTVIYDDLEQFADETINTLPAQQQAVFRLNRREGLTYDEIARRLQISPNTVRNHMVNALRSIRLQFTKHDVFLLYFISLIFS